MKLKYYLRGLGAGMILSAVVLSIAIPKQTKSKMSDEQIIARAEELGMKKTTAKYDFDAVDQSIHGNQSDNQEADSSKGEEAASAKSEDESVTDEAVKDTNEKSDQDKTTDVAQEKDDKKDNESKDETAKNEQSSQADQTDQNSAKKDKKPNKSDQTEKENNKDSSNDKKVDQDSSKDKDSVKDIMGEVPVKKTVTIYQGMTATQVAQLLEDQGIITNARSFASYLLDKDLAESILSKKYEIVVNSDFSDIAKQITR